MDDDLLAWIYSASSPDELRERYDVWAASYDADLDGMAWAAPEAAARRCAAFLPEGATVLDAGCGTGLVGVALRVLGVRSLTGLDLSPSMLARAADTGAYDELVEGSMLDPLPFADGRFGAVVSVGVFTFGHVGPATFAHLARVVAPGGHVTLTFRDDAARELGYAEEAQRLEAADTWRLVDCTEPAPLIVDGGIGADMRVWTWRVNGQ